MDYPKLIVSNQKEVNKGYKLGSCCFNLVSVVLRAAWSYQQQVLRPAGHATHRKLKRTITTMDDV